MRSLRTVCSWLLLAAAIQLADIPIPAQEQKPDQAAPEKGAPAAPDTTTPEPIPIDSIPLRAAEDEAKLQNMSLSLQAPDHRFEEVETHLPAEIASIDRLAAAQGHENLTQMTVSAISSLRILWSSHEKTLADWQGRLQRRSSAMSETMASIHRMRGRWIRTREEAVEAGVPQALIERIDGLLVILEETSTEVNQRVSALLTLQSRVSTGQAVAAGELQRVATAGEQAFRRLFTIDSPPLWSLMSGPSETGDLTEQIGTAWGQRSLEIRLFLSENAARVRLHVVLFGVLIVLMLIVRQRTLGLATTLLDPRDPARLFERPLAAATVLTLIASRWIYPYLSLAVVELLLLLLIFPILRLLPPVLSPQMRTPLYALAALFLIDRLPELTAGQPLLHRLLLLVPQAFAIGLFSWAAIRRWRTAKGRWGHAVSGLMQVGVAALSTALIANLVGAVALSRLLTTCVVVSSFLGIVLVSGVLVIKGLIDIVLGIRPQISSQPPRLLAVRISRWSRVLVPMAAGLLWLRVTLILFGAYYPMMRGVATLMSRRWQHGQFDFSIGELVSFVVVLVVGYAISRFVPLIVEEGVFVRTSVPLGLRATISTLARFCLLALGFLAALAAAGVQLGQFALIVSALGVGIGFGLQNLVNNFVSGLILAFERPMEVGDSIQVGTIAGRVRQIGLRSSILQTPDGAELILPNANLISNEMINWSLSDTVCRVEVPVRVAHGTDPRKVLEILPGAARGVAGVMSSPAPTAQFRSFGENSLDLVLFFWSPTFDDNLRLRSEVGLAVYDTLTKAGIALARPLVDLNVKTVTSAAGKLFDKPGTGQS